MTALLAPKSPTTPPSLLLALSPQDPLIPCREHFQVTGAVGATERAERLDPSRSQYFQPTTGRQPRRSIINADLLELAISCMPAGCLWISIDA